MTIQCRTGCGKQISYEGTNFPDGFTYYLPLNDDKTIHACPKLEYDYSEKHDLYDDDITDNHDREFLLHGMDVEFEWDSYEVGEKAGLRIPDKLKKQMLLTRQMGCLMFPSPLLELNDGNLKTKEHYTELTRLSDLYKFVGDYDSAITARLVQDKITHDQTEKIIELMNEQNNIFAEKQKEILKLNITALELRDKYYRKVEQLIKSFIRKKYSNIKDLQKDFPILFSKANELRANPSKHIKHEHDDVIEFLSFGTCVKILKDNKKNNKKNDTYWKIIDWDIINNAYYVVDRRNDMEHYSDEKLEESIPKETKALGYIFSKEIIDFFEKIDYV